MYLPRKSSCMAKAETQARGEGSRRITVWTPLTVALGSSPVSTSMPAGGRGLCPKDLSAGLTACPAGAELRSAGLRSSEIPQCLRRTADSLLKFLKPFSMLQSMAKQFRLRLPGQQEKSTALNQGQGVQKMLECATGKVVSLKLKPHDPQCIKSRR